jgi:hypothetical protein
MPDCVGATVAVKVTESPAVRDDFDDVIVVFVDMRTNTGCEFDMAEAA